MVFKHTILAAATFSLATAALASAEVVEFSSTQSVRHLGSFTGTAVYNSATDKLTVDLTNTSAGALTGFALEAEAGDKAKFEQTDKKAVWKDDRSHKGIVNAKPFGKFDAGAGEHGVFGASGAKAGLAAGKSAEYVFDVTGANAATLTTADFFSTVKPQIVASFAGFKNHHHRDRAGGFGHVVTTTEIAPAGDGASNASGDSTPPSFKVEPPTVIVNPPTKSTTPPSGGGGNVAAAVPLPPAAPAGLMMLIVLGLIGGRRRLFKLFA